MEDSAIYEDVAVRVGVIGCGKISGIYLENAGIFDDIEVVACSDLLLERAQAQAEAYGVSRACTPEELLADEEVEIVLNLTVPVVHAEVSMAALEAGKHVYTEKPLAVDREDGQRMLEMAGERGLRVGCAPDTFLGGGRNTCNKVIDEGLIGEPVAVTALMMNHGPEDWHPNPDFFYQPGAGPMFDLGPYYLSTLTTLMGPVRRVTAPARATFPQRMITSEPYAGTSITVNTPTHDLNRLGELCRREGVSFSYHNHDFEFAPLGGSTMWDVLVRETDPEVVHLELDLYWVRYGGADPEPLLRTLASRIPLVHLKDMAPDEQRSDLPVGEGAMPWNPLLQAADAAGVEWYVAEQDNPTDALEDVRTSLRSMSGLASA